MSTLATTIKNAIKRFRRLERYNELHLSAETLRELDNWIRSLLYRDDLTELEKRRLQDYYLQTLGGLR